MRNLGLILIFLIFAIPLTEHKSAKLVMIREDGKRFEVSTRRCRAGVFFAKETRFKCACVTGVWGFYKKYCQFPYKLMGGQDFCFSLKSTKLSQAIAFGNIRYPFNPSITHFREDFSIMTKPYILDDDTIDEDGASSFVTVTNSFWTLRGNTGETLCLNSSTLGPDRTDVYCIFNFKPSVMDRWSEIVEIMKGCRSENVLLADKCMKMKKPNDEATCSRITGDSSEDSTESSTESITSTTKAVTTSASTTEETTTGASTTDETTTSASTTEEITTSASTTEKTTTSASTTEETTTSTSTTEETTTSASTTIETAEAPSPSCQKNSLERENVQSLWPGDLSSRKCSRSLSEITLADDLTRVTHERLHNLLKSQQTSLVQMEELFWLHLKIIEVTCPSYVLDPAFISSALETFIMMLKEDFFYGVNGFESALFERLIFTLRRCLDLADPFEFRVAPGPCNTSKITNHVKIKERWVAIDVDPAHAWVHYEPMIESGWKLFVNSRAYCYKHFYRQNDHHAYSLRMMQLFSTTIFEKWNHPLPSNELYKFLVPNAHLMSTMMDNLDQCVAAVRHVSPCPVWVERSGQNVPPPASMSNSNRKKRSWKSQLKENRDSTDIWDGRGFCLHSPEDPAYYLGFGRCAHPP